MALTRKLLKGMGLTDEQVDTIIEAHTETVDGLKAQADTYKTDAAKVPDLEKKLREAENSGGEDWKAKYEKEHSDFETFKSDAAAKETAAANERLFRAELNALGITGKRADQIVKATNLADFEVKDGAYADAAKVQQAIRDDWSEFVPVANVNKPTVDNPPSPDGKKDLGSMSMAEYIAARSKK